VRHLFGERSPILLFRLRNILGKLGIWKRLTKITCNQELSGCKIERKMTGKGKVSLSFNNPGKQPRRHSFTDSRDFVWDSRDLFGNRTNDEEEEEDDATPSDIQPGAFPWGLPGQMNPFLKYNAGFLGNIPEQGYKRWSPKKTSKGTALARKVRGLRGSPKPVTSLESCLMAQMADVLISNRVKSEPLRANSQMADALISNRVKLEPLRVNSQMADALISNRVSRPLYFSSTVDEEEVLCEDTVDNSLPSSLSVPNAVDESSSSEPKQSSFLKLPNLSKFLKEYAAKLSITSKSEHGSCNSDTPSRRRARENDQRASSSPNDSTCKETLLLPVPKKQKISHSWHFLSDSFEPGLDRIFSRGIP